MNHVDFYLTQNEYEHCRERFPESLRDAFYFEQVRAFRRDYSLALLSILDGNTLPDADWPFPDGRRMAEELRIRIGDFCELPPCELCEAVLPKGVSLGFCCRHLENVIRDHLPHPLERSLRERIVELSKRNVNFPRILNRDLHPVIQNSPFADEHDKVRDCRGLIRSYQIPNHSQRCGFPADHVNSVIPSRRHQRQSFKVIHMSSGGMSKRKMSFRTIRRFLRLFAVITVHLLKVQRPVVEEKYNKKVFHALLYL
jgi:hypothetical protein